MTAHRWARAAAMIVLTTGTLAVFAPPVAAAPAPVRILSVSAENVAPGETVRVKFRVTNTGSATETAIVVVGGGLRCTSGCRAEPSLGAGKSKDLAATVVAPSVAPGESSGLNISVGVRLGGQNSYDFKMVNVSGAEKPAAGVDRVTGRVRDTGGKAVGGTTVTVRDSAGHEYRTTSGPTGRFSIRSSAAEPIAAGSIRVVATRNGYRTARATVQGTAGDTATVQMTLAALVEPVRTSSSPRVSPSPLAAGDDDTPGQKPTIIAEAAPNLDPVSDEGSGPLPFVFGGLLVVAGLAALALLLVRRRNARV
ncbi:carboxypeptidase-like regulatory domain-containing protein [Actinoplanes subglobosus]|uniref:Carboxypeptidase-like regulatory domain-containing protein n=1 Tax=Actinoplanes subglobosus TaxID=1547892 RepID=A0ABV8IYN5_9ACTN